MKAMNTRIGAMQPYLFPYLGYLQLISAVDLFVLSDDLQYIRQSWINRNRVLINGQAQYLIFTLKKNDYFRRINERVLSDDFPIRMERLLKTLSQAYARAPCFETAFPIIEKIIRHPETNLARYAEHSIRQICSYLDIRTPLLRSSDLDIDPDLDAQDRVIETVRRLCGSDYINPIGGTSLYNFDYFERNGITLKFLRMDDIRYRQYRNEFVPSLSIIDVMMFNDAARIRELLSCYSLNGKQDFAIHRLPFQAQSKPSETNYGYDRL
jgi:hypothetical protein